ncbi:alpha/beta hydrolase [Longimycelium tulufanense]|uniref:Alpha/beta hydrolase n=1 Tax=Longimycelium tulufanense TaxID=907463 RepID=A0A8J3CGN3_9PSEU|nr:alpha/beta hydrolase [Longimycelium tulufanense]GGM64628.1 alpha/beta hydrolase [Longimycelium tulufanense]
MTRALAALGAAALLLVPAACTSSGPTDPGPPQPHAESRGPAGSVPAGLDGFYGQALTWEDCKGYATTAEDRVAFARQGLECARLRVPLNYDAPQGRSITLGLLRRPAGDQPNRIGALVLNPGGPGASGMSAAANLAHTVSGSELGKRFDFVGFDPRGVGASEPQVRCLTDQERDEERLDLDVDNSPEGVARTEAEEQDYARKCAERTGREMLSHVGTRDVANDLDVLRSALGDEKLSYLGYSYGTRIGTAYAEAFPENVRALVLDGALAPEQDPVAELVAQGAGFQRAFDAFAAWCAKQQQCALGSDPARAVPIFRKLVDPLVDKPADAGDGRKLSYNDATTGVIQALYAESLWQTLNRGLAELALGRGMTLMKLADTYYGRGSDGHYSTITDAFTAVRCVDDARLTDKAKRLEADRRYREAAPFLDDGRGPSSALDTCAFWPVPPTRDQRVPDPGQLPTTLVISTTGDPATPYQAGVDLARALGARLLTYEGEQHTVFLQGVSCVDQATIRYLTDLEPPTGDTTCRR